MEGKEPCYSVDVNNYEVDWLNLDYTDIPSTGNISWDAATCNFTANGYRLPTESEWEYAARGGIQTHNYTYSGSSTVGTVAWYWENIDQISGNSGYGTHSVKTRDYNERCLYDMSGNLCEWCWNWYDSTEGFLWDRVFADCFCLCPRGDRRSADLFYEDNIYIYPVPSKEGEKKKTLIFNFQFSILSYFRIFAHPNTKRMNLENNRRNETWREELRKSIKAKERTAVPRIKMPELDAAERSRSYGEVNRGLSAEQALQESKRCLDCINPTCIEGCPVEIDIPGFIKNIERGDVDEAARVLKETSALPSVCGRVCPQEKQCESRCIYHKMNLEPVAIGYLERFAADSAVADKNVAKNSSAGLKIAVAGSGPAGLSFAGDMANRGYDITVFEALHEIGGVLKYGIPEFRLPNKIVDKEIENLRQTGVKFITNCIVGKTLTYENLHEQDFAGIFIATGAGLPNFMNIEGENLSGVLSANEYLTRINLMGANRTETDTPVFFGKNVAIIGGGNTAMDAVRTARRLGAEKAMLVYRRSEEEMPARIEEIHHAKEEGVIFMNLYNPVKYTGDEKGNVKQMILQKMQLGEPDASGRRRPVEIPGATETVDADLVIVAIGVSPNPLIPNTFKGLSVSKWGTVTVNQKTLQTDLPDVFAGGDIVRGGATVILAMGDGRKAAAAMHEKLSTGMYQCCI
jgi:glutamate synthase (NADPH/NADH) small chain